MRDVGITDIFSSSLSLLNWLLICVASRTMSLFALAMFLLVGCSIARRRANSVSRRRFSKS